MSANNGDRPAAGQRRIRVLIVENHQLVSDAMAALLSQQPNLYVVGVAATRGEAVARFMAFSPDVVLIDYHLAEGTGVAVAEALRSLQPKIKILFVSRSDGDAVKLHALEAGASGFIHKSKAAEEIVAAVQAVAGGSMLFTPEEMASLFAMRRQLGQFEGLTSREEEVLRLVRLGHGSREIAKRLGIAYATVRAHIRSIERKLGAHDKVALLARARELGVAD